MSETLTAAQILGADDLATTRVDCPEWGGHVFVRAWTGAERDQFEASSTEIRKQGKGIEGLMALVVVMSARDEAGNLLFSPDDAERLQHKSAKPVGRIFDAQMKLSGVSRNEAKVLAGN